MFVLRSDSSYFTFCPCISTSVINMPTARVQTRQLQDIINYIYYCTPTITLSAPEYTQSNLKKKIEILYNAVPASYGNLLHGVYIFNCTICVFTQTD